MPASAGAATALVHMSDGEIVGEERDCDERAVRRLHDHHHVRAAGAFRAWQWRASWSIFVTNRVMFRMGLRNLPRRGLQTGLVVDRADAGDADHHGRVHDRRHHRLLDHASRRTTACSARDLALNLHGKDASTSRAPARAGVHRRRPRRRARAAVRGRPGHRRLPCRSCSKPCRRSTSARSSSEPHGHAVRHRRRARSQQLGGLRARRAAAAANLAHAVATSTCCSARRAPTSWMRASATSSRSTSTAQRARPARRGHRRRPARDQRHRTQFYDKYKAGAVDAAVAVQTADRPRGPDQLPRRRAARAACATASPLGRGGAAAAAVPAERRRAGSSSAPATATSRCRRSSRTPSTRRR